MKILNKKPNTLTLLIIFLIVLAAGAALIALFKNARTILFVSVSIFILASVILTIIDNWNKPSHEILIRTLCTIIVSAGPFFLLDTIINQRIDPTDDTPPAVTDNVLLPDPGEDIPDGPSTSPTFTDEQTDPPTPTPTANNNHAYPIQEKVSNRYGREMKKNIEANTQTMKTDGRNYCNFRNGREKICLGFDLNGNETLSFTLSKAKSDRAKINDTRDWIIFIANDKYDVIYEGYVNRNEDNALFVCELTKGHYTLVILRAGSSDMDRDLILDAELQ